MLFFSSKCNKQHIPAAARSLFSQNSLFPAALFTFCTLVAVFAKQAVNYCGCSTFPVINISASHGQSQVRNTEAVKGGQFCSVFVIYLQYIRTDLVRALHCGILHNKILCFLCLYRVFKKTSPNSKVQNFVIVVLYPRRHLLFPRFLLITLSVPAHSSLFIWGEETLWIT